MDLQIVVGILVALIVLFVAISNAYDDNYYYQRQGIVKFIFSTAGKVVQYYLGIAFFLLCIWVVAQVGIWVRDFVQWWIESVLFFPVFVK